MMRLGKLHIGFMGILLLLFIATFSHVSAKTKQDDICPPGEELCGILCYNPDEFSCIEEVICPLNATGLCGQECYNEEDQVCFEDRVVCSQDEELCGSSCYNSEEQTCETMRLPCGSNDTNCAFTVRFIERFFIYILEIVRAGFATWRRWDAAGIYDRFQEFLQAIDESSTVGACADVVCPGGLICCPDVIHDALCYLPSNHSCLATEDENYRLCPFGSNVCGDDYQCYYPETHQCTDGEVEPVDENE